MVPVLENKDYFNPCHVFLVFVFNLAAVNESFCEFSSISNSVLGGFENLKSNLKFDSDDIASLIFAIHEHNETLRT